MGNLFSDPSKAISRAQAAEQQALESGIAEQRRQFDETRDMLMPYVNAGTGVLGSLTDSSGLAGFGQNITDILNDPSLQPLRQQRADAISTALGASGMLNSGTRANAIGNDLTDFATSIESLLNQRQSGLANMGVGAAGGLAGFGQNTASNISNLMGQIGQSQASGVLSQQQAKASGINQLLGLGGSALGGALLGGSGMLGSLGAGSGAALGLLFSDSRLKENIKKTGNVGPLNVYHWDWRPEVEVALGVRPQMDKGFLAEEVEAVFPQFVHPVGPFKAIDYQGLLNHLEEVIH